MRAILCVAMIALSSAAAAQLAPGRSGMSSQQTITGQIVWTELASFGACYASSEREKALKLVSTPAGTIHEAKVYKELFRKADQMCLGDLSSMSVPWQFVRGAVAEGFYAKRIPVPANLAASGPMLPENAKSLSDVALCYAGRHPEAARALIESTRPGTKKESEAIDAMMPELANCLPSNLPKAPEFDTMLIRYRIAEALWRLGMVRSGGGK
jgi:hypothetical protein